MAARSRKTVPKRGAAAPPTSAASVRLLRNSKGTRPEFFDEPAIDQLFAVVTALTSEIAVAFDRIDTLERLLQHQGTLPVEAVESYQPADAAVQARKQHREDLLQRVFAVFEHSGAARTR